jgi:glycine/D-amino acid oxidase-like deaminating enzyme
LDLRRETEVLIIGGGVTGAGVAYNIARRGKEVTLVERSEICGGTSGSTAGWLWIQDRRPDHYAELAKLSLQRYETLEQELGKDFEFRRSGALQLLRTKEELDWANKIVEEQHKIGIAVRVLSPAEVHDLEPAITPHIMGALYGESDGHVNPFLLVNGYIEAAKRYGAEINTGTQVLGFEMDGSRIKSVITNRGTINAGLVICAAGIFSTSIADMAGVKAPIHPERGFCVVTEKMPRIITRILLGARQTVSGNLVFGFNKELVTGIDTRMTAAGLRLACSEALRDFPGLGEVNIIRSFAGVRVMPDDKFPILGPVPHVKNFWFALTHSAFTNSCAIGPLMAELVCGERNVKSIPMYAYDRFTQ